jgi:hypothetical protein
MWTIGKFARFPNGDGHAKEPGMTSADIKPELLPFDEIVRRVEDCQACPRKPECCPDNKTHGRSVAHLEESPLVIAFRKKMASEEAQQRYRHRGRIAEFCHAWIKSKLGLRQFHV